MEEGGDVGAVMDGELSAADHDDAAAECNEYCEGDDEVGTDWSYGDC